MNYDNINDYIYMCVYMYRKNMCICVSRNSKDQLSSTSISRTLGYLEVFTQSRQVRDTEV